MARRNYGTGQLYEKHGAYYGRWRTSDGRKLNRKLGAVRRPGESAGLTRTQAERRLRQIEPVRHLVVAGVLVAAFGDDLRGHAEDLRHTPEARPLVAAVTATGGWLE